MLWSEPRVRQPRNLAVREGVADARRQSPEAEPWLALVEAALAEGEESAWAAAVPALAPDRSVKAPLLSLTKLTVDGRAVRGWVRRMFARVAPAGPPRIDGLALVAAAVRHDDAQLEGFARTAGVEPERFRVAAQIAALPLLQACGRALKDALPTSWWESYCPICGAWPALAEYTGLERKRQLRCGRCGTAWGVPVLRCVFCDETNHESLAYLTLEGTKDESRKIEVCNTCKGYVKATTTVRPLASWGVLLDDLSTVHLDLVALERGYERPARQGHALDLRIVERRRPIFRIFFPARRAGA